jgi:hypothetical protein
MHRTLFMESAVCVLSQRNLIQHAGPLIQAPFTDLSYCFTSGMDRELGSGLFSFKLELVLGKIFQRTLKIDGDVLPRVWL